MPCPQEINIPYLMRLYGDWQTFGLEEGTQKTLRHIDPGQKEIANWRNPFNCTKCGKCEDVCPNKLGVSETIEKLATLIK